MRVSCVCEGEERVEQLERLPAGVLPVLHLGRRHLHDLDGHGVVRVVHEVEDVGVAQDLLEQAHLRRRKQNCWRLKCQVKYA